MISSGCLSVVLFADRTLLMRYDADAMSAAMASGNVFWSLICLPLGIASMTGAFVAQYVGAGRSREVGRFLWQAVFFALATTPCWLVIAYFAPQIFAFAQQPQELLDLETRYMRLLMMGALAGVLESALSGFFSGTHRTMIVMWINLLAAIMNLLLDVPLIFGWGPIPAMGIAGAAIASVLSFWFKAIAYAYLLTRPNLRESFAIFSGFGIDWKMLRSLLFFGLPAGLQYVAESGAFTLITLQIGQIGSLELQATTMAINFNMIAFVPLIGVSIAASVVVGGHLTASGPRVAVRAAHTSLLIGFCYAAAWALLYVAAPRLVMSFYEFTATVGNPSDLQAVGAQSSQAINIAQGLLLFVASYILLDTGQLVLAGVLRGAGDTWFVLIATFTASATALLVGWWCEPEEVSLYYWWYVIAGWIWLLAICMGARFLQGHWKEKRLVAQEESLLTSSLD